MDDYADDVYPGHVRGRVPETHDDACGSESRSPAGYFPDVHGYDVRPDGNGDDCAPSTCEHVDDGGFQSTSGRLQPA